MLRVLGTAFAALAGLAFGSFLNVCITRWPQGESIVTPRSHCRHCGRTLAWWENVPVVSWLALRGRCRTCKTWIGWRYPVVELAVGALWGYAAWTTFTVQLVSFADPAAWVYVLSRMLFYWMLVALAVLDAEHLWLPNWLTWPGIVLGFASSMFYFWIHSGPVLTYYGAMALRNRMLRTMSLRWAVGILAAAGMVLVIRGIYWLIRRREGIGLGDAKLMAMLAAWLGLSRALLAFGLGVVLGALAAIVLLVLPSDRESGDRWSAIRLPLGTFLCVGGLVASLWGNQIIAAYLHWAGFY